MSAQWQARFSTRRSAYVAEKLDGLRSTTHNVLFNTLYEAKACADRLNARDAKDALKPFGHEVTVMFNDGTTKTFHYVGSAARARFNARMKPLMKSIVSIEPITMEEWFRAYGDPSWRGL